MNQVVSDQLSREFEDVVRELRGQAVYDGQVWWLLGQTDRAVVVGPSRGFVELVEETVRLHGKGVKDEDADNAEPAVRRGLVSPELEQDGSDGDGRGCAAVGGGNDSRRRKRGLGDLSTRG